MQRGMTIEYLKCRADLNFDVDFGVNGAIGAIVTKWDLILFWLWIVFIYNKTIFFLIRFITLKIVHLKIDFLSIYSSSWKKNPHKSTFIFGLKLAMMSIRYKIDKSQLRVR